MLSDLRVEIAADLTAGAFERAYDYTANSPSPPCAVVVPGQPYLEQRSGAEGYVFGELAAVVDVLLLAARDVNKKNAVQMDALIEQGLTALKDRDVRRVSRPDVVTLSGIKYLGAVITIAETWEAP